MTDLWTTKRTCRACSAPLKDSYLHLGDQPLANKLLARPDEPELVAPLAVALCASCGLSQLTVTVDPTILYGEYPFYSGTSAAWHDHCKGLVAQADQQKGLVVDIAANDGTLLKYFMEAGWNAVGVDPSDIEPVVPTPFIHEFFTQTVADGIVSRYGAVNLVVAQNVMGHVDDPTAFLTAAASMLAPEGKIVVEVPNMTELVEQGAFDTIYHEHLSYWSPSPMIACARRAGLALQGMERLGVHGGSRRYWFVRRDGAVGFEAIAQRSEKPYFEFARATNAKLDRIVETLNDLKAQGKRLWAFGASAKGTVMLNALKARHNTVWPEMILDDTRAKQGKFSPGLHIPVRDPVTLRMITPPDVLWLLSWNWAESLKGRARSLGYTGQFLVTSPDISLD